jgi:hypothetical protein
MSEQQVIIPSSPEDRKKIHAALNEGSDSLTRIAAERELIKEIIDNVSEEFDLPKKYVRKMINVHYKSSIISVNAENEQLVELYSTVTGIEVQ